ncbi:hypothetical protein EA908_13185, partial [Vibrio anguillarum]|nr:hypothetical protein [Vibrio anguillarum]
MTIRKYKIEILICSLATLCIFFGVLTSFIYSDWSWLERSGSLVVVVAISSFWQFGLARKKKLSESLLTYNSAVEAQLERIKEGKAEPFIALNINVPAVKQSIKTNEEQYDRLTKMEIILGGVGTFVWGYASPVFN